MITERMQQLAGVNEATLKLSGKASEENEKSLNDFMKDYERATSVHPLLRGDRVYKGTISFNVYIFDDMIHLSSMLVIGEPKQGNATKAMKWITDLADKHQVDMSLKAEPFGTIKIPKGKLISFYKKFGFKDAGWKGMIREHK